MSKIDYEMNYKDSLKYELSQIFYGYQGKIKSLLDEKRRFQEEIDSIDNDVEVLEKKVEEFKEVWKKMYPDTALEISDLSTPPAMSEYEWNKKLE